MPRVIEFKYISISISFRFYRKLNFFIVYN